MFPIYIHTLLNVFYSRNSESPSSPPVLSSLSSDYHRGLCSPSASPSPGPGSQTGREKQINNQPGPTSRDRPRRQKNAESDLTVHNTFIIQDRIEAESLDTRGY